MQRRALAVVLVTGCGGAQPAPPPEHAHHDQHANHGGHAHNMQHRFENADAWAKTFDDPERDAWQKPDDVIAALELTPAMHVADVGAGTGYFTMRLAKVVPQGMVLATDIEPDMVRYLGERAQKDGVTNVHTALSGANDPQLPAGHLDRILIVDVWHHIADRPAYAKGLATALKPGGRVAIVDFKLEASHGPPVEHRLKPEQIIAELQSAGLTASLSPVALPDQYIVIATK